MYKITFECEVITPMFLAGADGKTPELRAPSIKGALRFWWRAMNGHLPIDVLRKKEAEIFGGSGENEGKSKFNIRISHGNIESDGYQPLPHHDNSDFCNKNKCKRNKYGNCYKTFKLSAIQPEANFTVEFCLHNRTNIIAKEKLKNLFILTSILGSLGKRSRRGFGNFKINQIDNTEFNESINLDYIKDLLNSVNIDNNNHFQVNKNEIKSNFNLNHFPYVKEIKFGKASSNYNELLKKIGEASHFNDSDYTGFAKGSNRFASPVYVSVMENGSDYVPVVTILETVSNNFTGKDKSKDFIREVLS